MTEVAQTDPASANRRLPPARPLHAACKRAMDVAVSAVGLVLTSPVLAAAALAVRLDSPGPVLFRQERLGRGFHPFKIYKFRTMVADAHLRGAQITAGADPRITRVGRWLRQTKIDELPQLFNVLKGEMSLVGPRPEVSRYVEQFREDYAYVLSVRPGITDLASVKYRNEAELLAESADPEREYVTRILPDKIALARQYIDTASLWGDLRIMAQTGLKVLR